MFLRTIVWFLLLSTTISFVHASTSLRTLDAHSKSTEEEGEGEEAGIDAKGGSRVASWTGAESAWSPGSDLPEKRRLGSALNIGRGRDKQKMGKREPQRDRGYGEQQLGSPEGFFGPTGGETDKRNLGSAMNLIKVRKNTKLGFVPEREFFVGEEFRNRRRLGSAMNLKKLTNNAKTQPRL